MSEQIQSVLNNQPKNLAKGFDLFELIDKWVKGVCIVLLGAMTIIVFLQVFFRFVIAKPLSWTEELSRYLMIWGAFIGASSMLKTWENVYVDYFIEKLPFKKAVYFVIKVIMFIFMIYTLVITVNTLPPVGMFQTTPALGIPMFWAHLGMIIGLFLITIQLLGLIINDLSRGGRK